MKRAEFQSKIDPSEEVRHLRAEIAQLESALNERKETSGQIIEQLQDVLKIVPQAEPPTMLFRPPRRGKRKVESPITHAVHISDWHIGQKTKASHIEEFGSFDYQTAVERVGRLGHSITKKTDVMRSAYDVPRCHVIGTADWVSGDIHQELTLTNEFPCPVQAVRAGFLLGTFLLGLSQHFEHVEADFIAAGNHDRITKKRQYEGGGENSWGYVACEIARLYVSNVPSIKLNVHLGLSAIVKVENVRYLVSHGDGIKGTWGIPYYGVERQKMRESMSRMNMDETKHFDKIVIGHFHSALNHEHWLIGGSLSGTTALDHGFGRHSKAHQTSWFVHPTHNEFDWTRWWL